MLRVAPILELRIVMALGPAESSNPVMRVAHRRSARAFRRAS